MVCPVKEKRWDKENARGRKKKEAGGPGSNDEVNEKGSRLSHISKRLETVPK